jgi:uncharacterized damage-inducible protein DinB
MTPALTLEELLHWNDEASRWWKAHLGANLGLLELPCDIGGVANVQGLVRHIWVAELRWAHRLAQLPEVVPDDMPAGPLDALYATHIQASEILHKLLADPNQDWEAMYTLTATRLPPEKRIHTRRKIMGHALLHAQRHWAQLATLVRAAGFASGFGGDLLFSTALR